MKVAKILVLLIFILNSKTFSQGTFQSNGSGNWDSPSSWTLVSGTSTTNFPGAGDTANINSAHSISVNVNSQCDVLNVTGGASLQVNTSTVTFTVNNSATVNAASVTIDQGGIMTVTGTLTQSAASTITVNLGALTVIGVTIINAPTVTAGTTLLDVESGVFTCAGGMTLIAFISGRTAELRINEGFANVAGGLATISSSAKINFTGAGTLTLAGIISIPNTSSFISGIGRVVYFGIPGSDQVVAPLTYNRLVIAGIGAGVKTISGSVTVKDTLMLLIDTLIINSGGSLHMNNNTTIVRTAGRLFNAPVFAGVVDVIYNNVVTDTTGDEMPTSASTLHNLTINDIGGIKLGANITVNNNVDLQQGALITDGFSFTISNPNGGATADPAVSRTNGYVIGAITRAIGTTTGIRSFPLGTSTPAYREFQLEYTTAPTSAGSLTVEHFDTAPSNQSGLPLQDGAISIINTAPLYWQADASGGLAGGTYTLSLTAEGTPGVSDLSTLRIIKRPSAGGPWITNGTPGTNTGTLSIPVVVRTGMSGFSQFTLGSDNTNTLPVKLVYFTGKLSGQNVLLSWATSMENNTAWFQIERSKNSIDFLEIGKIAAAGNSTVQTNYNFTDYNPVDGANYYRLKQIDRDGNYAYSNLVYIQVKKQTGIKVYPTIASNNIIIEAPADEVLKLFNATGQFIRTVTIGTNNINDIAKGYYFIFNGKQSVTFVKQ